MVVSLSPCDRRVMVTAIVVVVAVMVMMSEAVDRSKFKTCSQSGFCRRNRDFAKQTGKSAYAVVAGTERSTPDSYNIDLTNKVDNRIFTLTLSNYGDATVRVQVRENPAPLPRYQVPEADVLLESAKPVPATEHASGRIFGKVEIEHDPFVLKFYGADGAHVISANALGLFNIEEPSSFNDDDAEVATEVFETSSTNSEYRVIGTDDSWEETFSGHRDKKPKGPTSISMDFTFHGSKHLYGIPEHAADFALPATKIGGQVKLEPYRLYNLDVFEYELRETMALYGSVPLLISHQVVPSTWSSSASSSTTAVFWLNAAETWVDIAYEQAGAESHWFSESGIVDAFVLLGPTPSKVSAQYAALTGTTPLPPLFSLAYHQCRWNYKDEADVADVNHKFDVHNLPMDVIWLDIEHTNSKKYFTWDTIKFPTPEKMLAGVASKGRRMVTIVDPHIKREDGYHIHDGATARDLYVKRADGVSYEGFCWPGPSMYLDFTNADVRRWWSEQFAYTAYHGSTESLFIWNDMNEPSVFNGPEVTMFKDLLHSGGWEHRDVHNLFGLYVHRATYEGLVRRNADHNTRPFVLSRAIYSGSQRYGAIWTGDNAAQWDHLEFSVPMLLSLGVSGITFAGADVGGFFGNPDTELLTRWYQAGAYQPFFRGHAHLDSKRREPYLFDQDTLDRIRTALRVRYALLPFWYTQFYLSTRTGAPVMRPLWYEFPTDPEVLTNQDSFLVGSDLLVRPVVHAGGVSARVYLPGSEPWYDVVTLETFASGAASYVTVPAPIDKIPVFQRGGSIVPRQERPRRSTTQMVHDPYTLVVALDSRGSADGELYIDDFRTFNYQRSSEFVHRAFSYDDGVLESRPAQQTQFQVENLIERITIVGLKRLPTKVVLRQDGTESTLDFSSSSHNSIIIRQPNAAVSKNWRVTLHF